jgi:hypothetical protein
MAVSYITATTTAVATAVGMNMLTKVRFGAALDMVVTRGQQNPRENCFFPGIGFSRGFEGIWVP